MAKLKLLNTIFSKLGSLSKNDGQIVVTRDSKSLYIDLEGERIEITDWIDVDNEESLLAILSPLTNKYYYTKDTNKIWRYVGSEWICLNNNINEMMPTYIESTTLTKLKSGEKISVAFGKISKAVTDLISHIGDSVKHITSEERTNWDSAKTHADSTHARTDATKVEKSTTNGNIKINGSETVVYTHPSGTNPHGTTKSDIGLGNVGNFKAVSTVASQGLTDTEKSNARANIGAGTSSFSGSYNDLSNKPTIPTVGNGTVTIKQAGTSKGTFTMNQSGDTVIELTDNNTWRGIQNNLTSDSTTDSLSAAQGKVLKGLVDGKAASNHTHNYLPLSGGTVTGEIVSKYANGFRIVQGNYGFFIRTDSNNTYLMLTNSGDQYGSWNSLRPMIINNATGNVSFANDKVKIEHSTGIITAPRLIGKSDSLQGQSIGSIQYVTDDTHILQLGYWNCTGSFDRATLLISSAFYGDQHGSGDIIHISQDKNQDATVRCSLARTKLHVKGTEREFYFKVDNTNKRIYLYVKVFGDNGYGNWSICPIMFEGGTWVTEAKFNQPTTGLVSISQNYASASHSHSTASWTGKTDNRNYQVAYSLDAQFNYDSSNSFQYNPSTKTLKAGTFHGALDGNANSSSTLINNSVMNYGWNGVNYFNFAGTAGNAAKVNDTPTSGWWHIMRFNHNNSTGYYTDLAIPFNDVSLYYKRITRGSVQNNGWIKVLDSLNYKSYCTPANIGAMGSVTANGYEGMARKDGNTSDWIRTTTNGIIPYESGGAGSGHSSLGTSSWYFSKAYIDNIYGYLNGNISGNAATATKLENYRTIFGLPFNGTSNLEGKAVVFGTYISDATNRFQNSGIEVRENNRIADSQSDIGYAPSIGFNWAGVASGTLCLDKDGIFHFLKTDGTRATLDANINGNINGYTWSPETEIPHVSGNTSFKILALDGTRVKHHRIPEYIIGSYNDSTFYKVTNVLTFKDTNNALITGDKGNFIWSVSSWSDRKLKKNIKDADISALDKINQIQFKEFDFIDDKKFGKHQELGYIADELKEVFPECVVTVPQDKEKFGYEELDQVQDVGMIKYLAKAIQELTGIIQEQNNKIDKLQKEVDKLKRKN